MRVPVPETDATGEGVLNGLLGVGPVSLDKVSRQVRGVWFEGGRLGKRFGRDIDSPPVQACGAGAFHVPDGHAAPQRIACHCNLTLNCNLCEQATPPNRE
jgi:hypothetical protein